MKQIFYRKEGRKYIAVSEYDQTLLDALPKGTHLIQVYPGGQSTRYNIDPNYAAVIAATRVAEDVISQRLMQASDLRLKRVPLTEGQKRAWAQLVEEFGEEARCLEWPSAREASEAACKAMQDEALKLMDNPAVRKAYERFLFVCELTKEHDGVKR